jgi:ferric enterobactin receptor
MRSRKIFTFLSLVLVFWGSLSVMAQTGRITGRVKMEDGTPLPGAAVAVANTLSRTGTDSTGEYTLFNIRQGLVTVVASLDGFKEESKTVLVQADRTMVVDFVLELAPKRHETTVTAERPLLSTAEKVSEVTITPSQIETLPSLGEKDIFRALQLLPGISGSQESSSGLYIRGGTPDQNLIMYDGFTVYHVDHLFGYFSAFNMEAVREVRLSKGGYESKYGGRLSSIMELTGKPGSGEGIHGSGGLSLLSLNGLVEVPLFGKGSFVLAGRRSFQTPLYDSILGLVTENTTVQGGFRSRGGGFGGGGMGGMMGETQPESYFYDLNSKLTFRPSSKDHLFLSFYNGLDNMDNSREQGFPSFAAGRFSEIGIEVSGSIDVSDLRKWGNTGLSANWTRQWHESFQSHLLFGYSNYLNQVDMRRNSELVFTSEDPDWEPPAFFQNRGFARGTFEDNDLHDYTFRWDNSLRFSKTNQAEFGVQVTQNQVTYDYDVEEIQAEEEGDTPQAGPRNFLRILNWDSSGTQYSAYVQDRWTMFGRFTLTPGIRINYFDSTKDSFVEPRLAFSLSLTDALSLKGAWGRYSQIVNNITREDVQQGNREFWALSDGEIIPFGKATHYILGFSYDRPGYLFDVEVFYKDLSGLSEYALRFTPTQEDIDYNRYFYEGTGVAKGLEFLLQKKIGPYTGWISYTLSSVEHTFLELENDPFPALQDQTHEFKLVNSYDIDKWTFSGTFIYATGRPYTAPAGVEEEELFEGRRVIERVIMGEKNGARLPAYHRLDLSASYRFQVAGSQSIIGATVFNLYDRKNVWHKEFDVIEGEIFENNILYMGLTFNLYLTLRF